MALSHTFSAKYNDNTPIPNYYRSSVFCLEKLTTSGISLTQIEEKFNEKPETQGSSAWEYATAVIDRIAHIRRIAIQLGEDVNRYPPLHFPPGKLLDELHLVITEKEKQLLESKRAHMNRDNVVLCNSFLRGTCTRGVTCSFSHTSETLVAWLEDWLQKQVSDHGEQSITITEEFGPEAWMVAFDLIAKQATFSSIVLRGANMDALRVLVAALRSNALPSLQFLDLGKNYIGQSFPRVILKLAKALAHNSSLSGLCLGHNMLGAAGALSLCQAIHRSPATQIVTLNLQSNGISSVEAASFGYLCEALGQNTNLRKLNLGSNDLGPEGVRRLLEALQQVTALEFLDLSSTRMGDAGAKHLGAFINETEVGQQLRLLNIGWNKISNEGLGSVCDGLFQHRRLEIFRLPFNVGVGRKGAMSITELLKSCTSLAVLDLRWTQLGDDGAASILDGLGHNNSIRELSLLGNDLSHQTEAVVVEKMKKRAQASKEAALKEAAGRPSPAATKQTTVAADGEDTDALSATKASLPVLEPLTKADELW